MAGGSVEWYRGRVTAELGPSGRPIVAYEDEDCEELGEDEVWRGAEAAASEPAPERRLGKAPVAALQPLRLPDAKRRRLADDANVSLPTPPRGFTYKTCSDCGGKGHGWGGLSSTCPYLYL